MCLYQSHNVILLVTDMVVTAGQQTESLLNLLNVTNHLACVCYWLHNKIAVEGAFTLPI